MCLLTCLAADEIKIRRPPIYKRTAREINADLEACGNSLAASSVPPLAFGNETPKAFVFSRSLDAVDSTPFASIGRSEPRLRASLKRPSDRKLWSSIDCPFGDDKVPTTRVQVLCLLSASLSNIPPAPSLHQKISVSSFCTRITHWRAILSDPLMIKTLPRTAVLGRRHARPGPLISLSHAPSKIRLWSISSPAHLLPRSRRSMGMEGDQ